MKNEFEELMENIPFIQAYALPTKDEPDEFGRLSYLIDVKANPNNTLTDVIAMLGKLCLLDTKLYFTAMNEVVERAHEIFQFPNNNEENSNEI